MLGRISSVKVTASLKTEVEISREELGRAVMQVAIDMLDNIDDAGCDWLTDDKGNTYIADKEWHVSSKPIIATLVDTYNFLTNGQRLRIDD